LGGYDGVGVSVMQPFEKKNLKKSIDAKDQEDRKVFKKGTLVNMFNYTHTFV
jgi:hypothetical protein